MDSFTPQPEGQSSKESPVDGPPPEDTLAKDPEKRTNDLEAEIEQIAPTIALEVTRKHLERDRFRYLCSIFDLHKGENSTIRLRLRRRSHSSIELAGSLRKPPKDCHAQILPCPEIDIFQFGWFRLEFKIDFEFRDALFAATLGQRVLNKDERETLLPQSPRYVVMGQVVATISYCSMPDGQDNIPVVIISNAAQTQVLEEQRESEAMKWSETWATCLNRLLEEKHIGATSVTAIQLAALLPLEYLSVRNIRTKYHSVLFRWANKPGVSRSTPGLSQDRLQLRRLIEESEDDWDLFTEYMLLKQGEDWLKAPGHLVAEKAFRKAISQARRLEAEIRDFMQLQVGELALEESKKSIDLSNLQIQEGKQVKIFTILAFVYVPLNLATSIFGMNLQQLNGNGKDLWIFITTAVLALLITGGSWLFIEGVNAFKVWRRRKLERSPDLYKQGPKYSIGLRVVMISWLMCKGYGLWMWKSGAWLCILTNDRHGEFQKPAPFWDEELPSSAGHYVWKFSQNRNDLFSYVRLAKTMKKQKRPDNTV